MRIDYTCEDGSRTLAKWPSMALQHWLGRSRPTRPIENPEPFKLYVVGPPVPSDDLTDFSKNHFSPAEFENAVRSALRVSDEYVWIYTEQPRWWTKEKLPQTYVDALAKTRNDNASKSAK